GGAAPTRLGESSYQGPSLVARLSESGEPLRPATDSRSTTGPSRRSPSGLVSGLAHLQSATSHFSALPAPLPWPVSCCRRSSYCKLPLPPNQLTDITEQVSRYGRVKLEKHEDALRLVCSAAPLLEELSRQPKVREYLGARLDASSYLVAPAHRGVLKQALIT